MALVAVIFVGTRLSVRRKEMDFLIILFHLFLVSYALDAERLRFLGHHPLPGVTGEL